MHGDQEAAAVGGVVVLREGPGAGAADGLQALAKAREHLLSLQDPQGWWKGELQTNVTMDAEDMLLREFLGIREPSTTARSATWIRSQQRADGSWANFHDGPGDLSTTIEAYVALRLAGDGARRHAHARRRRVRARAPAASSARASSPTSGSRCSARGRGGASPSSRRS